MKKHMIIKTVICLFALGAICWTALAFVVFFAEPKALPDEKRGCAIVLGARVMPDGELSTTLLRRVETAYDVFAGGYAEYIIVCGAQGGDEPETEAAAMKRYLVARGAPEDRVIEESESRSTIQNLQNAKAIMEERGIADAVVISSNYHVRRALWIAEDLGIDADGASAAGPDLLINRVKARYREALSWTNYLIRYRIFK